MKINLLRIMLLFSFGLFLFACDEDDNGNDEVNPDVTGSVTADDQVVEDSVITISAVTMSEDGWVVIHRDNGSNSPVVPDIISEPKMVDAGTSSDVEVTLKPSETVADGEKLWVMLHKDNGETGVYEFDGQNGLDAPLTDEDGDIVMEAITVMSKPTGSFTAEDQTVENNTVIVQSVTLNKKGWVVIHKDNGNGEPMEPEIISEPLQLDSGTTENVEVQLEPSANLADGDQIWIMLHTDNGEMGTYEYSDSSEVDAPITDDDGNVVTSPITVDVEPTGTFVASDQVISQNVIMIDTATFNRDGWIVIHKDNGSDGPVVPEIISVPTQVEAGMNTDVAVPLKDGTTIADGEKVWIMLHTDDGELGTYEFDGSNGLDAPIVDQDGNVVTAPVVISAPGITANDQAVVDNQVTISEVNAARDGWLVIHNDDGSGNITLPDIIGKAKVTAGMNNDVVVDLDPDITYTAGQKLFPMLHIDDDPVDEYNFPGEDVPEVFGFEADSVVVTSFTVQ